MRRSLVVANWKMHGSLNENAAWFEKFKNNQYDLTNLDVVIAPSYVYLAQVQQEIQKAALPNLYLSTQDISNYNNGAYTGQVSLSMVKDFAVKYVIIGHSERRALCFEDDELVAQKTSAVLSAGLKAIVCLGETLEERKANQTHSVIIKQLKVVLGSVKDKNYDLTNLVVAYEPVWAIGTGLNATPDQAQDVHSLIRKELGQSLSAGLADKIRIIYGGSVKPDNAQELFNQPDIDGGLVGGASLDASLFAQICSAASLIEENQ